MNPLVKVTAAGGSTDDICSSSSSSSSSNLLGQQDLVIATGLSLTQVCVLVAYCSEVSFSVQTLS
jgi:hypothetical protein